MQASSPSDSLPSQTASERFANSPAKSSKVRSFIPPILDWLAYAGIALCSITAALIGIYQVNSDVIAYLDLSDAVRLHRWHALFNASWFPLYPALVAAGKAVFSNRLRYEFMAARLVDVVLEMFCVLASVALAESIRRLMLARGTDPNRLLPRRTLYLWIATFTYFFVSQDLAGIKPDALMSSFMLLAVAALLWGTVSSGFLPYIAVGLCGALAYWTKAFAFPVFILWIFLAAVVNLRNYRVLGRLLLSLAVFALIAAPYVWQISAAKGRFTIGDAGGLNSAWYVNGADRFNPVSDPSIYMHGQAEARFKHPGELLSTSPEITYYGGDQVFGTIPQFDDFSYWFDGLKSRFVPRQLVASVKTNVAGFFPFLPMRFQAVFLIAALYFFGFRIRAPSRPQPILLTAVLLALASITSLMLVHFEARYVTFAFVILGALYAACSQAERTSPSLPSLHVTVLLMAGLILLYGFQNSLREGKQARQQGAHPWQGIYSLPVFSAGSRLASIYPPATEVACMGDTACWADPYWAKYAGLKMTAIVETGNGYNSVDAMQGCIKLQQNPSALNPLRQKHIRAIVAEFGDIQPCSPQWQPLGESGHYFYLPL